MIRRAVVPLQLALSVFINVQRGTGVESHERALRLGAGPTQWAYYEAGLNIPRLALEPGRRCAG